MSYVRPEILAGLDRILKRYEDDEREAEADTYYEDGWISGTTEVKAIIDGFNTNASRAVIKRLEKEWPVI